MTKLLQADFRTISQPLLLTRPTSMLGSSITPLSRQTTLTRRLKGSNSPIVLEATRLATCYVPVQNKSKLMLYVQTYCVFTHYLLISVVARVNFEDEGENWNNNILRAGAGCGLRGLASNNFRMRGLEAPRLSSQIRVMLVLLPGTCTITCTCTSTVQARHKYYASSGILSSLAYTCTLQLPVAVMQCKDTYGNLFSFSGTQGGKVLQYCTYYR